MRGWPGDKRAGILAHNDRSEKIRLFLHKTGTVPDAVMDAQARQCGKLRHMRREYAGSLRAPVCEKLPQFPVFCKDADGIRIKDQPLQSFLLLRIAKDMF